MVHRNQWVTTIADGGFIARPNCLRRYLRGILVTDRLAKVRERYEDISQAEQYNLSPMAL